MMKRPWLWAGVAITVAAVAALAIYFAVVGLDDADKVASVVGALIAVVGLAVALYGVRSPAAGRRVSQKTKASGHGRINQVGGDQGAARAGADRDNSAAGSSWINQRAQADDEGDVNQVGGDQRFEPPAPK